MGIASLPNKIALELVVPASIAKIYLFINSLLQFNKKPSIGGFNVLIY